MGLSQAMLLRVVRMQQQRGAVVSVDNPLIT